MTSQSAERIGGWLLAPLARLLVALLSASLSLLFFANALMSPQTYIPTARHERGPYGAVGRLAAVCPRHVVLHALADYRLFQAALGGAETLYYLAAHHPAAGDKGFAFSPVSDVLALRQLLFPLLAAALLAPYFRRSQRVKRTFVNP